MFRRPVVCFLFPVVLLAGGRTAAEDMMPAVLLQRNETLAVVGGTFVEKMQAGPWLDAELLAWGPIARYRTRNLGWAGDDVHGFARKVFETDPGKGFQRLLHDLELASPDVVLVAYGFSEAADGASAVREFEPGLRRLTRTLSDQGRRVILMRPFAMPGIRTANYEQFLAQCNAAIDRVGNDFGLPIIEAVCDSFTDDGMLPDEAGYRQVAQRIVEGLFHLPHFAPDDCPDPRRTAAWEKRRRIAEDEHLGELIRRKDELFFHRHRPQNETYLLLFRKHEQGNNAVELPEFDRLIGEVEEQIWARAEKLAAEERADADDSLGDAVD